jgi:hypothetical protein
VTETWTGTWTLDRDADIDMQGHKEMDRLGHSRDKERERDMDRGMDTTTGYEHRTRKGA